MAICFKCMTGFDSNLERCPQCGYVYRSGVNRRDRSRIVTFVFFLFIGIGIFVSAAIFYFALVNLLTLITWEWLLFWALYFSILNNFIFIVKIYIVKSTSVGWADYSTQPTIINSSLSNYFRGIANKDVRNFAEF
ncbi:MAG: hypothetical protein Tsb0014_26880 [Pleurocapsa sp.]